MVHPKTLGSTLVAVGALDKSKYPNARVVVKGNLVSIDYGDYIIKEKDGKEVRVHIDKKTQVMGQIKKGDRVEAKVDAKDNALLIRSLP